MSEGRTMLERAKVLNATRWPCATRIDRERQAACSHSRVSQLSGDCHVCFKINAVRPPMADVAMPIAHRLCTHGNAYWQNVPDVDPSGVGHMRCGKCQMPVWSWGSFSSPTKSLASVVHQHCGKVQGCACTHCMPEIVS